MDIEKLKRCLKCCADDNSKACNKCELEYGEEECQNLCGYAATALSALQIENQALRNAASGFKAENERLREMYQKEKAVCHATQAELEQVNRENETLKDAYKIGTRRTDMERLTKKRDRQNVIPLKQNGETKWVICSAGMGDAPTEYLYGEHADRLAAYEEHGTGAGGNRINSRVRFSD